MSTPSLRLHQRYTTQYAFKLTLPVLFAYFPLGVVFGVLFVHQGFEWFWAPLMSMLAYAGTVQFLVLTMLDNGATVLAIAVAAFLVAFRNAFYGVSFLHRYRKLPPWLKGLLAFGMVDATYAVLVAHPKAPVKFCIKVTALLYLYWVAGTLCGAVFANAMPMIDGLEFVLTSFFGVLVVDFYHVHKSVFPLVLPIIFSIVAYVFFPEQSLVIAILLSVIFLYLKFWWNEQ